jgi:hypothetical protein
MKSAFMSLVILVLSIALIACNSDSPSSPSQTSVEKLGVTLLTSNEIPPITNAEAGGSASATLTFNLTKDVAGAITAASMDLSLTAAGFPSGTTLTRAHIHSGGGGVNGGVFVNAALADGEVRFASGGGSFSKTGIAITVDQVRAILGNPSGFYFNIHTAINPDGVARGQLTRQ